MEYAKIKNKSFNLDGIVIQTNDKIGLFNLINNIRNKRKLSRK